MLTCLVSVENMILLNSALLISAAPVAVEKNVSLKNLEMKLITKMLMMVVRIMMTL